MQSPRPLADEPTVDVIDREAPPPAVCDARIGRLIAGKYRIEAPLGSGAMGSVWRAIHVGTRAPVALKLVHADYLASDPSGELVTRFMREAEVAAKVRGPNVVRVLDYGVDVGNVPYLVMEVLEGETLIDRLQRPPPPAVEEVLRISEQIAMALDRAAALGYIHRDLKPSNVFLAKEEDRVVAKLVDFGLAKPIRSSEKTALTALGAILGTPDYMSPEQARGAPLDARSDLWSLAVIVYFSLTGYLPFDGESVDDVLGNICEAPAIPFTTFAPELVTLAAWHRRAFQKDPDRRFQSGYELVSGLAEGLDLPLHEARPTTQEPSLRVESSRLAAGPRSAHSEVESSSIGGIYAASGTMDELTAAWERAFRIPLEEETTSVPVQGLPPTLSETLQLNLADRVYVQDGEAVEGPFFALEIVKAVTEGRVPERARFRRPESDRWMNLTEVSVVGDHGKILWLAQIAPNRSDPERVRQVRAEEEDSSAGWIIFAGLVLSTAIVITVLLVIGW